MSTPSDAQALLLDERPRSDERVAAIEALTAGGDLRAALWQLRAAVRACREPAALRRLARLAPALVAEPSLWRRACRVALLSSSRPAERGALIRLYLAADGIAATVYEAPFGQIESEIADPEAGLRGFRPDITILAPSFRDLAPAPTMVETELARWSSLWRALDGRVIQHAFEVPLDGAWGNLDLALPHALGQQVRRLNLALAGAASSGVAVLDVEALAAEFGKRAWSDPRFWFIAKDAVAVAARPTLAQAEAAIVRGMLGMAKRVVAVDLDNTLWGGVVGEDGVDRLELAGTPVGEAFVAFQRYLKALRARGVLLAVVSKNNDEDARLPFLRHPEMALALGDFAAFRADWGDKSEGLRVIARELGLGLDSVVFVDDNPGERAEVRAALPEVEVVALPTDAVDYVAALARDRWFDVPALTDEDLRRADDYAAVRATREHAVAGSLDGFLASLGMTATIAPFDEANLPRIVQLFERSNQYNLTTVRYTEAQTRALLATPAVHTRYLRLRDASGDRGLVSLVVSRLVDADLVIESWVMSCRVLNRTVEQALLAHHVALGRSLGARRLLGGFRPTAKNAVAGAHYARLGFRLVGEEPGGASCWERAIVDEPLPRTHILVERA